MKSIVAVDEKWGIGKNNDLLFDIKADMRHFVEHTRGKIVVMAGEREMEALAEGADRILKGKEKGRIYGK